jgi:hypothetical protein
MAKAAGYRTILIEAHHNKALEPLLATQLKDGVFYSAVDSLPIAVRA